jgi:thioredoxin reductase (NADPH)
VAQSDYDVIVIGEGIAGLSTASELAAGGLKVATFEAQLFGGLVVNVNDLEPPLEGKPTSGAELAAEMMQTNADAGVASVQEPVTGLEAQGDVVRVTTDSRSYSARHVVVASGARLKKLGVPGEDEFEGRGVSQCADCDGPMYQSEEVVVVGGGDSALQEAAVLTQYCRRVHLVHRGEAFSANPHLIAQVEGNEKITTIWNAIVEAVIGTTMVEKTRIRHANGRTEELPCAGVFAYIGLVPNSDFLPSAIERDEAGHVKTNDQYRSTLDRVWAVGAVRSGYGGSLRHVINEAAHVAQAIKATLS